VKVRAQSEQAGVQPHLDQVQDPAGRLLPRTRDCHPSGGQPRARGHLTVRHQGTIQWQGNC
jgi:hypothetical protein